MTILPQYFVRLFPVLLLFSSVLGVMTIPLTLCNTEEQLERRLSDAIVKVYAKRVLGEGHTNDPYTSQGIDPRKLKSKEKIIIIFGFERGLDFHAQNEKWEVKKIVKRPYKGSVLLGTLRFDSTQIKHNFLGLKRNGWITGSTPGFQSLTTPATSDRIHAVNEVILRIRNLKGIKFKETTVGYDSARTWDELYLAMTNPVKYEEDFLNHWATLFVYGEDSWNVDGLISEKT
ncbi:hypothetical protein F5877DRAFT_72503 [Lentinula edodes]|nr:hypothetical protein F5877DRAFT_72503 [Lentinula edodes]